jgi:outer membrane receptor for ferric coprogen and ferric-rhodotorulic acid
MIRNSICRSKQAALRLSLNVSSALLAPVLAVALSLPAQAQSASAARTYNIPAQSLGSALREYMRQSGVQVGFPSEIGDNVTASAVVGTFSAPEALSRLLAGTGLTFRFTGANTVTLERAPQSADGAVNLGPVRVEGEGGNGGYGGVTIANRTAPTEGTRSLTTNGPVTAATGLNLTLRETPQSVTVITRERIEQQNLVSLADVAEQVPGVFFNGIGTAVGGRSELYSRGFTINNYQVDGVNVPWASMGESDRYSHASLDTAVYDSITVVRGATGFLAGVSDPSGSISLTRKRPTENFQIVGTVSLGTWDRFRLVGDISGPLNAEGTLRARVVGARDQGKSWIDRYKDNKTIGYGIVEADLSPSTLLTVGLEYADAYGTGAYWHQGFGPPIYFDDEVTPTPRSFSTNMSPNWTRSDSNRLTASAAVEQGIGANWNLKLTYIFSKFKTDNRRAMVFGVPADGSPTDLRLQVARQNNTSHVLDGKIEGTFSLFGRDNDLAAGFNLAFVDEKIPYSHFSEDQGNGRWVNGEMVYTTPDWDSLDSIPYQSKTRQHAAYIATRLRPTERLSVILGGRLSYWKIRGEDLEPYFLWDDRKYSGVFTPYAGAVLDLTKWLSAYASYTESFVPQSSRDVNGNLLDPEQGKNVELGLKGEWFDGLLNASAAVFETRKDNLAVEDFGRFTPDGDQAYRAESNTKGRGWEIEIAGEILPGWQVQSGFTHFKIRDSAGDPLDSTVPVDQFKFFTSYRPAAVPGLNVGAGVRWQGKTYPSWIESPQREGYTVGAFAIVSANASYEFTDKINLSVNVNNLLDKAYRTNNFSHSYGAPRNVMATLRAQY